MLREAVDEAEIHYSLEINVPPCLSICMVLSVHILSFEMGVQFQCFFIVGLSPAKTERQI